MHDVFLPFSRVFKQSSRVSVFQYAPNMGQQRFQCGSCSKNYARKFNLIKHVKAEHKEHVNTCDHCGKSYLTRAEYDKHLKDIKRRKVSLCQFCGKEFLLKRSKDVHEEKFHPPSPSVLGSGETVDCVVCKRSYQKRFWYSHQRSVAHMENLMTEVGERVKVFESSFGNRCTTYRLKPELNEIVDIDLFLRNARAIILPLIERELIARKSLKYMLTLVTVHHRLVDSYDESNWEEGVKHFNSNYKSVSGRDECEKDYDEAVGEVLSESESFEGHSSGWALLENVFILVNILTQQIRGSGYIALPIKLARKNALINIENVDDRCFLYCVAHAIYGKYVEKARRHLSESYIPYLASFDVSNLRFPLTLVDMRRFERQNIKHEISVNIYGYEDGKFSVLRLTKAEKINHVDLLLIESHADFHYVIITDLSRLISSQISRSNGRIVFCRQCLTHFRSEETLLLHKEIGCLGTRLETPKVPYLEFKKYFAKNRLKFVVYADLETLCVKVSGASGDPNRPYSRPVQLHRPYAAGYKFVCFKPDMRLDPIRTFRGEDSIDLFLDSLLDDSEYMMRNYYYKKYEMTKLSTELKKHFDGARTCFICEEPLERFLNGEPEPLVYDHDHHIPPDVAGSNCRGLVHNTCNLRFQEKHHLVVVFHSGSSLDWHIIIKAIARRRLGRLECIAKSSEKYISFSWRVKFKGGGGVHLRFIDSFRFLPRSLASIIQSMDRFPHFERWFRKEYPDEIFDSLLLSKPVMCYDYIDDLSVLYEKDFPSREKFFSTVTNEGVSEERWKQGKEVFERLNCKNLYDYVEYYMKTDIFFLCDGCESFRDVSLKHYKLDSMGYYITLPSFAWDACLLYTKKRVELQTDLNGVLFCMQALKGGVVFGNVTTAESNSRYCKEGYSPEKGAESQILMFDIVSLYSKIMSTGLLCDGGYEWIAEDEIRELESNIASVPDDGCIGYLLECDVDYPKHLHSDPKHVMWPLLAQNRTLIENRGRKLFTTLYDKKRLIVHNVVLNQALRKGLQLVKVYRGLKFRQSNWLHAYIKRNIELRSVPGQSPLYVQIFKDMNNVVYGKLGEKVENYCMFRLIHGGEPSVKSDRRITGLFANPRIKHVHMFDENLIGLEMSKTRIVFNRPVACGVTVLELSKAYMVGMIHDVLLAQGGAPLLLYSDTDSMYVKFSGSGGYEMIKRNPHLFDTSEFPKNNKYGIIPQNHKISGLMAVEKADKTILSFVYLRPKSYAVMLEESETGEKLEIKKAKGTSRAVIKGFTYADYVNVLRNGNKTMGRMMRILSKRHEVMTLEYCKVALSSGCNKRVFDPRNGSSLPYGHASLVNVSYPFVEE